MSFDDMRKLLAAQEWDDIYPRLLDFAEHRAGSRSQGEDLAHSAIAKVYSVDCTWDPEKEPKLLRHLMSLVNTARWAERTRAGATRSISIESKKGRVAAEAVRDESAYSEDTAAAHDLFSRRWELLRARMASDPDVLTLLDLRVDGVDTPAEIRNRTGWRAEKVMSTHRRFMRAAAIVARDVGGDYEDEPALTTPDDDDEAPSEDEEEP